MQLSIVIVNFRTFELTCNCIRSIQAHVRQLQYEIILVDNAPIENKKDDFLSLYPSLKYISTHENVGFSRANNLGISYAQGAYILLLNSDTLVIDDSLEKCFHFMEDKQNQKIGALGCKLLNADYSYQPSFYPFVKDSVWIFFCLENPIFSKFLKVGQKYAEPNVPMPVGDISGAFMFLRKEVIAKVKDFDPDFFLYYEETEWCKNRIAKLYQIFYLPQAKVIHLGGQSTPNSYLFAQARLSLSLAWYKRGLANYLLYILCCYVNLMFFSVAYLFLKNKAFYREFIKTYVSLIPYLVFEIPRFSREYGSRPEPLILHKAKKYFK